MSNICVSNRKVNILTRVRAEIREHNDNVTTEQGSNQMIRAKSPARFSKPLYLEVKSKVRIDSLGFSLGRNYTVRRHFLFHIS